MSAAATAADTLAGALFFLGVFSVACLFLALASWWIDRRDATDFDVPQGRERLGLDSSEREWGAK